MCVEFNPQPLVEGSCVFEFNLQPLVEGLSCSELALRRLKAFVLLDGEGL